MIDLIIPYYNNPKGLIKTLSSINQNIFYITVVDDHSNLIPWRPKADQVLRYNQNHGPGFARQHGINKTSNPYIMFIDTGDIFTSFDIQEEIKNTILAHPEANMFSFPYFYNESITKESDNRMHGKVYKRSFINKYNITFAPDSSYFNEDIGFNKVCRRCTEYENQPIIYGTAPVLKWIKDINSLSQKDNQKNSYTNQNRALSIVSIHTINILKNNNIDYIAEINQISMSLYYWFIRTAAERPEYIQNAWSGAKIFYDTFKHQINFNQIQFGNNYLKRCLLYRNKINFPINIQRFIQDIQSNENIPSNYLNA